MSVHKAISKHSEEQHLNVKRFHQLEEQRESAINEAVSRGLAGEVYSIDAINEATRKIHELGRSIPVPERKLVTTEMVEEYISRLKARQ